jgi:hypothetical protein
MIATIRSVLKDLTKDYRMWIFCAVATVGTFAGHYNQGIYGSKLLGIISIAAFFLEMAVFYWALASARRRFALSPERSGLGIFLSIYAFRLRLLLLASPLIGLFFYSGGFERVTEAYTAYSLADREHPISFTVLMIRAIWPWVIAFWIGMAIDFLGRSFVVANGKTKSAILLTIRNLHRFALPLGALLLVEFFFFFSDFLEVYAFPAENGKLWITPLCQILFLPLQYFLQLGGTIFLAKLIRSREQNSLS